VVLRGSLLSPNAQMVLQLLGLLRGGPWLVRLYVSRMLADCSWRHTCLRRLVVGPAVHVCSTTVRGMQQGACGLLLCRRMRSDATAGACCEVAAVALFLLLFVLGALIDGRCLHDCA
jgi:hypothetical protein